MMEKEIPLQLEGTELSSLTNNLEVGDSLQGSRFNPLRRNNKGNQGCDRKVYQSKVWAKTPVCKLRLYVLHSVHMMGPKPSDGLWWRVRQVNVSLRQT